MKTKKARELIILLLLSGLAFHDFFIINFIKLGPFTITYLRIALAVSIPLLIFLKLKIPKYDAIRNIFFVFMIYGLSRIGGNIRQAFTMYCPMLAFFLLYISIDNEICIKKSIDFLAKLLMLFCFLGLFEQFTGHHFGMNYLDEPNNDLSKNMLAFGMYYNENDFSAFLTVLLFYLLLSSYKKEVKLFFSIITIIVIYINQSMMCLLGILSYILIAYIIKGKKYKTIRIILIAILAFSMSGIVIKMVLNSSIYYRIYMYSFGIKNCIKHLWFGTGIGNYGEGMLLAGYVPGLYTSSDPHNIYLELAGQFGMVWSVLLLVLIGKLLYWFYKRKIVKTNILYFGLIFIVSFVGLSSSTCLEKNYIYLALLIPLIYYRIHKKEENKESIILNEKLTINMLH